MKPNTPEQLARLLDQISSSYPNGIPRQVIKLVREAAAMDDAPGEPPRFHIFIVGEETTVSGPARDLLDGITSKGLKISANEYQLSYASEDAVEGLALSSVSRHTIVFGKSGISGWVERSSGSAVLFAPSLEGLVGDAGLKKALWRDLQALL